MYLDGLERGRKKKKSSMCMLKWVWFGRLMGGFSATGVLFWRSALGKVGNRERDEEKMWMDLLAAVLTSRGTESVI